MGRRLFVVEDTFTIKGRGQVLVPGILPEGDECFRAGWDDGAEDAPLTQAETDKVIALLNLSQPDRSQ